MSHLLQTPSAQYSVPFHHYSTKIPPNFSSSLPKDLDNQLRELRASISSLDKRPIHLNETKDPSQDQELKSEIIKLNKEILGLQSDLYKLNTKYIAKGLLSPDKASFIGGNQALDSFLTPKRQLNIESDSTVRPSDLTTRPIFNNDCNQNILNEANISIDFLNINHPALLNKYFSSPDNMRRMVYNKDYERILLNFLQLFNELNGPHSMSYQRQGNFESKDNKLKERFPSSQVYEFETKPIDFKNYFKTSFNDAKSQGILKKKNQNIVNSPKQSQRRLTSERSLKVNPNEKIKSEESFRESRFSNLSKEISPYKLYNNRSESERFLHEEQGWSIDEIPRKKKTKPIVKRRRNMDIITNLPKKIYS